jgi:hypothetical protein
MKSDKTLDKTIETVGEKVSYDTTYKGILRNKDVLALLISNCMSDFEKCDLREIAENYIQGEPRLQRAKAKISPNLDDLEIVSLVPIGDEFSQKVSNSYDVSFSVFVPRLNKVVKIFVNVDTENEFVLGYAMYRNFVYRDNEEYLARGGEEFEEFESNEDIIVWSIWIHTNPQESGRSLTKEFPMSYTARVNGEKMVERLFSIGYAGLGGSYRDARKESDIVKLLEVVFSTELSVKEKRKLIEENFSDEIVRAFDEEVSYFANLN